MTEPTASTEELFLIIYCLIDDLYPEAAPDWVRFRNGTDRMDMTDSEIITLSIMQEGQSNDSELSFHRVVQKDYLHLFPDLICRSRYHRRRKALMGVQSEMLRLLMNRLRLLAVWLALDSAPITTAESPRWKSAQMSIWAAEAGFSPSKRQFFLGFRLHLLVSNTGAICDFVLSPANVPERQVAEHLLAVEAAWQARQSAFLSETRPVLADNGYCGDWLAGLFGKHGGALWYALRRSKEAASEEEAALRAWHRGLRARIESVFASLDDQFQIEETRARSVWGVMTRVVAKLLAYMVGFVVNEALGRPGTALKSLYR
ncbi:MAG: IS982 family transposase [Salinivenus sp.]